MTTTRIHTRSEELRSRALELIPGGVNSNVRLLGPATFFAHGRGSRLVDVDGNEYIDYLLGQGPNFLGHAPTDVLDAVDRACRRGMVFGAQHELELEAAEVVLDALGWAERIRFCMTGTEAIQAALRLARAVTGRERFVRFAGHYHGWIDNVLVAIDGGRAVPASAGQLPAHLDDSVTLPYNDLSALERTLDEQGEDVAAVLMEPVMLNAGSIEPSAGYLEGVREICDRHGVVLIFDEVISGFRVALGGATERYGVTPDIATYGKAMAAGWPVAAIAGDADLMDRFGTGEVNHSGTFNATVMACAATVAAVRTLAAEQPYATIEERGRRLMDGLAELANEHGLDVNVQGPPMAFHAGFGPGPVRSHDDLGSLDIERYESFSRLLVEHGVWVAGRGIWYLSTAHDDADIDETLDRISAAFSAWEP
jgi:glutamate-1-semialdehyde 2,1-aminomutase